MADIIQVRRDTAANWTTANPILAQGEVGYETDTQKLKIGTGSIVWNSLVYHHDKITSITGTLSEFNASLTDADFATGGGTATGTNTGDNAVNNLYSGLVSASYATITETTIGTEAAKSVTPDGLAGSSIFGVKAIVLNIIADATDVDTTSGVMHLYIPAALNGMNLIRATAMVTTAGTTNATTIQIRNLTKYSSNDSLSTAISIASAGTVATAGTVNATYDNVSTDDKIKIYVTANSTTKAKGLYVVLEYQLP